MSQAGVQGSAQAKMENGAQLELNIGEKMLVRFGLGDSDGGSEIAAQFLGRCDFEFLILRLIPVSGLTNRLIKGAVVTVRFVHHGAISFFTTELLGFSRSPEVMAFLAFPRSIKTSPMRRNKRLACNVPIRVYMGNAAGNGFITDLSLGGCKLLMDVRGQVAARQLQQGDKLELIIPVEPESVGPRVAAEIKSLELEQYRLAAGLAFDPQNTEFRERLNVFLQRVQDIL